MLARASMLEPSLSILDETDSGLDIDALRIVADGVNRLKSPETAVIVITHYQRLLDYIKPDIVHVLYQGRIIKTAGPELALELEERGYDWVIKEFEDSGYNVSHTVLKAVEYGVPQKRERVIIVGFRKDLDIKFSFPEAPLKSEEEFVPLKVAVDDTVDEKYFFSQKAVDGMMRNRESMNKGRAQDINQPCNTVGAHLAKVSLNSTDPVLMVDGRYRRFTPREVARIQSFPEEYKLSESESAQYRALGNAIPPVMFWHVAQAVCAHLSGK